MRARIRGDMVADVRSPSRRIGRGFSPSARDRPRPGLWHGTCRANGHFRPAALRRGITAIQANALRGVPFRHVPPLVTPCRPAPGELDSPSSFPSVTSPASNLAGQCAGAIEVVTQTSGGPRSHAYRPPAARSRPGGTMQYGQQPLSTSLRRRGTSRSGGTAWLVGTEVPYGRGKGCLRIRQRGPP